MQGAMESAPVISASLVAIQQFLLCPQSLQTSLEVSFTVTADTAVTIVFRARSMSGGHMQLCGPPLRESSRARIRMQMDFVFIRKRASHAPFNARRKQPLPQPL